MNRVLACSLATALLVTACTRVQNGGTSQAPVSAGVQTAAPLNTSTAETNPWTVPHVLRVTMGEDVRNLNAALTQDLPVSGLIDPLTQAYLVRWGRDNQPIPELVTEIPTKENGGVSADGLIITYHLRKGVRWSDGAPFSADDVVFSIHAVNNPNNNIVSRSGWDRIASIQEPDKYTVVLHLSKPYSPFLETFFSTAGANPAVMPAHILAGLPNINNAPYNAKPVGIGPFMVQSWERGTRVVMVANPYYFRGMPKLKEIDYELITNTNTVLTQMQGHDIDMFYQAPQNLVGQFAALRGFITWTMPSYLFRHLDFNLTSPRLSDPAVREALRYAMNRPQILAKLYHGIGHLQDQPAPYVAPYWDPNIPLTPFNVAKANQILDQAGWKLGPGGIREKNGVRLNLEFVTASGIPINDQLVEMIRQTWKQIGVGISVDHYLSTILFGPYQSGGILYTGKFDVAYFAWGLDAVGDYSILYACDQIPPSGQNILHWCDPKANAAMHDLYAQYDQAGRNKDDAVVSEQLDKQVPTIVLMGTEGLWVTNRDLKNFNPGALSPFDNFMDVDI
jgi:peptide/nickel transport system substrate-binding protein